MGSDGTLGLQAIKATGGLTGVESPESAQFDAMPKSAIEAGCADILAPADELPDRILAYVRRVREPNRGPESNHQAGTSLKGLDPLLSLLQQHTRHDFSLYKPTTLHRRIERRMAIHGITDLADYTRFLADNNQEVQILFRELLIGVTQFFRDPETWNYLVEEALPELISSQPPEHTLRAWVVGCSTGEEAYSLAMAFAEARLARFFTKHDDYYQIRPSRRDKVLFATHDVILDPPFTKLDMIACRNLLIYFDLTLQRRILRLYRRQPFESDRHSDFLLKSFPPMSTLPKEQHVQSDRTPPQGATTTLQSAADYALLQVYAPAAVVLNADADIVYISGRTGKYLEPAAGKANWNIHAMAREGLREPLYTALQQASNKAERLELTGVLVQTAISHRIRLRCGNPAVSEGNRKPSAAGKTDAGGAAGVQRGASVHQRRVAVRQ